MNEIRALGLTLCLSACSPATAPEEGSCLTSNPSGTSNYAVNAQSPGIGGNELAQSFQLLSTTSFNVVHLGLKRLGQPSGILTLKIQGSSGTDDGVTGIKAPDGNTLAEAILIVSPTQDGEGNISTDGGFYTFSFDSDVTLEKDLTYWLRLEASYSLSDTDHVMWMASTADGYANGRALYESSTANEWKFDTLSANTDFVFKVGCSQCAVSVTQPTSSTGATVGATSAQSFMLSVARSIQSIDLNLKRTGAPNGVLTLKLLPEPEASPGIPDTDPARELGAATLNVSSQTSSGGNIASGGGFQSFTFDSAIGLSANTPYWMALSASYVVSGTDFITWLGTTSNPYAAGSSISSSGTDLFFRIDCED